MTTLAPASYDALGRYASGTAGEHFAWWCEEHCVQTVDQFAGLPLVLEPWQRAFFDEALAVDAFDAPYWLSVVIVLPRKNGKTTALAALSTYRLLEDEGQPEVLLTASSDKQAGRLFDGVAAFVRESRYIADKVNMRHYIGELARVDGGGKILRMASDPDRAHGYNPSLVVADELHAWRTPSLRRAWAALTTAGGARRRRQVFSITTAGEAHERETGILGRIIDQNEARGEVERRGALTISRNHEARTLVFNYSAETASTADIVAVKAANPASWVTEEYLRRQSANPELSPEEFLQLHACVWTAAHNAWLPAGAWASLRDPDAAIPAGAEVYIGVDVGIVHDSTAVAVASTLSDGRIAVSARVFAADHRAVAHEFVPGGRVNLQRVEDYIQRVAERYSVRELVYDPRFFERSAQALSDAGLSVAAMEQNSGVMADALQGFYVAAMEGRIAHDGDPVLADHVVSAAADKTERGWKIRKLRQSKRIDACVAAVMAHSRAERYSGGGYIF